MNYLSASLLMWFIQHPDGPSSDVNPKGVAIRHATRHSRLVAKSHFRNGGANLPVCRGAQQGAAHHFGNDFWQSLYSLQFSTKYSTPGKTCATQRDTG